MAAAKRKAGQKTARVAKAPAKPPRTLVTQSEYARHRDVSAERVRQWRVAGQLVTEGEGRALRVDVEASDARIARYRDPQQDGVGDDEAGGSVDYQEARARREQATAAIQELKLAEMRGRLIDRADNEAAAFDIANRHKVALVNMPPRVAAMFAARVGADEHTVRELLDEIVRDHLAEIEALAESLKRRAQCWVNEDEDDHE